MDKILMENVANIAYALGARGFSKGGSQEDVSMMIDYAIQFEDKYRDVEWDVDLDYIEAIDEYIEYIITREGTE